MARLHGAMVKPDRAWLKTTTPYSGKTAFNHLKLIREKTDKGYQHLGPFYIDGEGKLSAMPHQPVVANEVPPAVL